MRTSSSGTQPHGISPNKRTTSPKGYSTASEYICALIREDQKRKAEEKLEALLLEGLEGDPVEVTDAWWDEFRARLIERHRKATAGVNATYSRCIAVARSA